MEALYKKLYSKYTTLKVFPFRSSSISTTSYLLTYLLLQTNKLSEFEDINKEQELKFLNFVSGNLILHNFSCFCCFDFFIILPNLSTNKLPMKCNCACSCELILRCSCRRVDRSLEE
jgi:hypothetical protein